jgi:ATP-dependent helicase/nuclease subunit A
MGGADMMMARAYEIDGEFASAAHFIEAACDPRRSVVVEACAGSGKTWLLVARMLRLLLAGAAPSELLAITFTRKAAQEMRERLLQLLHELALASDQAAATLLLERGVARQDLARLLPVARGLYERVLSSPQSLSIDTFHSWFARLLQIAPLAAGVPHGYMLKDATGELMAEAYRLFMQSLNQPDHAEVRQALLELYEMVGDLNAKKLLDAFVGKRAEWWAATGEAADGTPLDSLQQLCGSDGRHDARLSLWQDQDLMARLLELAALLGQGAKRNQERAVQIESALSAGASLDNFLRLLAQFCDDKGAPRGNDHRRGQLQKAIEARHGADGATVFEDEFGALADALLHLQRRSAERTVLALNSALFVAGSAYLARYQALKATQRVFDFADLEWQAYRLLTSAEHASYLHSRLDSRYKHILLDEFQDTNPLQWCIVQAWLDAYGDDSAQPSVFVVGDPKQSIYRFRRAEPRVFAAARQRLQAHGAAVLRTSQTRRNAHAIVELLNDSFAANPIFAPQTTLHAQPGAVWRLPLVGHPDDAAEQQSDTGFTLRDPLSTPRDEEEDARRREEGRAVAQAIWQARRQHDVRWSGVMLLVKKRKHLGAYESALREAGIPFVSDKRGGLLQSLEIADLIALLSFLITPGDDRALAHVLKSPIMHADDDDLILLAARSEKGWWPRLQAAVVESASPALMRAASLLEEWLQAAPRLPVHDLLDLILHQGQLMARYAQATPPLLRNQVIGNIETFTELALNLDAGRYPSLPKFIDALRTLLDTAESDAPDEANVDAAIDAVRILTIHSAKGLEAPVVVLLDANHSEAARDDSGILCDWQPEQMAPGHFSAFGRKDERGIARDPLFQAEEQFRQQEDWNLLYVAVTRAKTLLIVSGVAGTKNAGPDGVVEGSWYQKLLAVPPYEVVDAPDASPVADAMVEDGEFSIPLFDPPSLAVPHLSASVAEVLHSNVRATGMREGVALHTLMERVTYGAGWPVTLPPAEAIAPWIGCNLELAALARSQAEAILNQPQLERFFNPAHYRFAHNEIELMAGEQLLRLDRLVGFDDTVWILDYKRNVLDSEIDSYRSQLAAYRKAGQAAFPQLTVKTALITVDGRLWEID